MKQSLSTFSTSLLTDGLESANDTGGFGSSECSTISMTGVEGTIPITGVEGTISMTGVEVAVNCQCIT